MTPTRPENFWRHVQPGEGCWLWTGEINRRRGGYGRCSYGGRRHAAHRVAWTLTYGVIPYGLSVLHHCDVPACCRPEHLFLGTQPDNMRDCLTKGRLVTPRTESGRLNPRWKGGLRARWDRKNQKRNARRWQDATFRARDNQKQRERWRTDAAFRARSNRRRREQGHQRYLTRALDLWQFWQTIP